MDFSRAPIDLPEEIQISLELRPLLPRTYLVRKKPEGRNQRNDCRKQSAVDSNPIGRRNSADIYQCMLQKELVRLKCLPPLTECVA